MFINLTAGIPEWFIDQFKNTLYHVQQQKISKFRSSVTEESLLGAEDKAFNYMGKLDLVPKTGRNVATPTTDVSAGRRWVSTDPYHNAWLYDKDDDLSGIINPTSDIVTAFTRGVNRKYDDIVLAAFDAAVYSGRRKATTTITWAAMNGNVKYTPTSGGRTIPHDCSEGNCSASDTGMTIEKAELIKEYFNYNEVDEDSPIFCMISPRQATNLFGQAEYVNKDYSGGAAPLATGRIVPNWHGINWIISNKVVKGSSNDVDSDTSVYKCWAWLKDGIVLGVQDSISVKISDRADLSHSQQVYVHMNAGAMRFDEDLVCVVECQ